MTTPTKLAYLTDPLTLEFEAVVLEQRAGPEGSLDLTLERTYFYPTGGGQPHDTGWLDEARVVEVFKDEQNRIIHRIEGEISGPRLRGRIDAGRRRALMRHHSAQHILSAALEQTLGLETLSVKISAESPSTLDVPDEEPNWTALEAAERLANQIILENRPIKSYFIEPEQVTSVPFRRPPQVSGQIRVVEVEGVDYSACGGTHCPQSGMIGSLKIIKTERQNQKLRLHFVAGEQAVAHFQQTHNVVAALSAQFSAGPEDLAALAAQQAERLRAAEKELAEQQELLLQVEAETLAAQAQEIDGVRLVCRLFPGRPAAELRRLGELLLARPRTVALLAGYDPPKLSLVAACAEEAGLSAQKLLARHLTPLGGRGGGNARLAQGGGQVQPQAIDALFEATPAVVRNLMSEE